jgi:alkylation response protein AidB-like acyl-CoA dehydrogenase
MDFRDTPEEAIYRKEVAGWLAEALSELPDEKPANQEEKDERAKAWQRILNRGGWAGITWPKEYGGRGLTPVHEGIFFQESARYEAPQPSNLLGMILAGPTLMVHGTEEQKERFLPRILSGDEIWCQGFSEPQSGSDLAGLKSKATRDGDEWSITGRKIWNSFGHMASWCMMLARTDNGANKHGGITYFLAPMEQVETRPLVQITGAADFNELFFENLRVPHDNVVGGVGNGWRVAMTTLSFERTSLGFSKQVETRRYMEKLTRLIISRGLQDDTRLLGELGRLRAQSEALGLSSIRAISALESGGTPGPEGSTAKLTWAHQMQDVVRLAVEILGPDLNDPEHEDWRWHYLRGRCKSVEGGTDEIQRSVVAERVLGLPRSR